MDNTNTTETETQAKVEPYETLTFDYSENAVKVENYKDKSILNELSTEISVNGWLIALLIGVRAYTESSSPNFIFLADKDNKHRGLLNLNCIIHCSIK